MRFCDWVYYTYQQGGHDKALRRDRESEVDGKQQMARAGQCWGSSTEQRPVWLRQGEGTELYVMKPKRQGVRSRRALQAPTSNAMEHAGWF